MEEQYCIDQQDEEHSERESQQSDHESDGDFEQEQDPSHRHFQEQQQEHGKSHHQSSASQRDSDPEMDGSGEGEGQAEGGVQPDGQFYQLLYEIEYLVKMVEENDQKFVMVKWKNFGLGDCTKEPFDYIKGLQLVKDDLRKLEEDFQQKKYSPDQIVNVKAKTREFIDQYRHAIFPDGTDHSRNRSASREKRQISIEQLTRCKRVAFQSTRKKLQMELNDLSPEDYFYFRNIYHDCQYQIKEQLRSGLYKDTDMAPQEVVAVCRSEGAFRYILEMEDERMCTFSLEQMKMWFPVTLAKFLRDFLDLMEEFMAMEIDYEEKLINHRLYRLREVNRAKQIIGIKENIEFNKEPMFFGVDEEDALQNRRKSIQRRREGGQRSRAQSRDSCVRVSEQGEIIEEMSERGEKSEKQTVHGRSQIDGFYNDMRGLMSELGIKANKAKHKKKSKKEVIVNFNKLELQYHQYINEVEFQPSSVSLSSNSSEHSASEGEEKASKKDQKQQKMERKGSVRSEFSSRSKSSKNRNSSSPNSRDSNAIDEEVDLHTPSRSSSRLKEKPKIHYNSDDSREEGFSDKSNSSKKPTKRHKRE